MRGGYVLIMLLVVIAIGLMIYYADMGIFNTGGVHVKNYEPAQDQPWYNDPNHKRPDAVSVAPKKGQKIVPFVIREAAMEGPVVLEKSPRGTISLKLELDGTFTGTWKCSYSYTHAAYTIDANVVGRTDRSHTYTDAKGNLDTSKVFIYGTGDYTQIATNLDSGERSMSKGTAYVNADIDKDFTATGKISIGNGRNWHSDYPFTAPEIKSSARQ
jgi:hypothetical protein